MHRAHNISDIKSANCFFFILHRRQKGKQSFRTYSHKWLHHLIPIVCVCVLWAQKLQRLEITNWRKKWARRRRILILLSIFYNNGQTHTHTTIIFMTFACIASITFVLRELFLHGLFTFSGYIARLNCNIKACSYLLERFFCARWRFHAFGLLRCN